MENWGLVTFRETALLYSDEYNSAANKQRVAEVVAHELAHFVSHFVFLIYIRLTWNTTY